MGNRVEGASIDNTSRSMLRYKLNVCVLPLLTFKILQSDALAFTRYKAQAAAEQAAQQAATQAQAAAQAAAKAVNFNSRAPIKHRGPYNDYRAQQQLEAAMGRGVGGGGGGMGSRQGSLTSLDSFHSVRSRTGSISSIGSAGSLGMGSRRGSMSSISSDDSWQSAKQHQPTPNYFAGAQKGPAPLASGPSTWYDPNNAFNNPLKNKNRKKKNDYLTKAERKIIEAQEVADRRYAPAVRRIDHDYNAKVADAQFQYEKQLKQIAAKKEVKEASLGYQGGPLNAPLTPRQLEQKRRIQNLDVLPGKMKKPLDDYMDYLNVERYNNLQKVYQQQQWPPIRARNAPQWVSPAAPPRNPPGDLSIYRDGPLLPKVSGKYPLEQKIDYKVTPNNRVPPEKGGMW